MSDLAEIDPKEALATLESEALSTWSDEKKSAYCKLVDQRTRVARYILITTARKILKIAATRKFLSERHTARYESMAVDATVYDELPRHAGVSWPQRDMSLVGGRVVTSLNEIADARAKEVLSNLPPLQRAVSIIDAPTGDKIRKLEKLQRDVVAPKQELDEVSQPLRLSEVPQDMTIGRFREVVHEREARRQALVHKINKMSQDAQALDGEINKALFGGLPGLTDAIIETVESYYDQAVALEQAMRRIEEQVRYGDSEAALSVLRQFEQDEAKISTNVAIKFKDALDRLKLSVEKGRKRRKPVAEITS